MLPVMKVFSLGWHNLQGLVDFLLPSWPPFFVSQSHRQICGTKNDTTPYSTNSEKVVRQKFIMHKMLIFVQVELFVSYLSVSSQRSPTITFQWATYFSVRRCAGSIRVIWWRIPGAKVDAFPEKESIKSAKQPKQAIGKIDGDLSQAGACRLCIQLPNGMRRLLGHLLC